MKRPLFKVVLGIAIISTAACVQAQTANRTHTAPIIDGNPDDVAWVNPEWRDMKYLMLGSQPEPADFTGRYTLTWTEEHLYLLAEITDDILIDTHPDPLDFYWADDALEIFVDEDGSGGLHQFDYNAFAYHVALDNQSVDIGPYESEEKRLAGDAAFMTYPEHVKAVWKRSEEPPYKLYWEVQMTLHDVNGNAVGLSAGKKLGFMVAYCDADGPAGREHFMGDVEIEPVDGSRDRGYIDASVFGELTLTDSNKK